MRLASASAKKHNSEMQQLLEQSVRLLVELVSLPWSLK